jgi:hypothetical protein
MVVLPALFLEWVIGCTAYFTIYLTGLGSVVGGLLALMVLIGSFAYASSIARATWRAKMASLLLIGSTSGTVFVFCTLIITLFPFFASTGGFAGCSCKGPLYYG